ncbi:DUF4920 domain-containing protein [Flavobacterium amniphilum]|uniref:DUF4920 domain-containing protein n=1 Tax=Flavobacterium amniphilum TaxID=1834035 RepID=UPI00202A1143|nr:DUF4920 domain-containing protein [Flavobacterium amniphilum]MCL9805419.1 DUF4920 domain-containing protein [Flavobacterium amniphilum]
MKKIKLFALMAVLFTGVAANAQTTAKKEKAAKGMVNTNDYAVFGEKFTASNVLTEKAMLKKYKSLKKGDTITVKFKSVIKEVCKKKGCWMNMDLSDNLNSFVRFKDYGFFVPLNADGSEAIVSGKAYIDVVSVDELRHYAKDAKKSQDEINKITKPKVTYAFQATGVLIKKS